MPIKTVDELIDNIFKRPVITVPKSDIKSLLDNFELSLTYRTKQTASTYLSIIKKFLAFAGARISYTQSDVYKFLRHLENSGFSRNYQRISFYALKKFFKANNIVWSLSTDDLPKLIRGKINKPTMSSENVVKLITYTKKYGLPFEKAFLALSTTYGLRISEIEQLKNSDVNLKAKTIHIQTLKGGEERVHIIPNAIIPYLNYNFDRMPSTTTISKHFNKMCQNAGIKRQWRENIHSLRRSLLTELANSGIPELMLGKFMRWRKQSSMTQEYYNPEIREVDNFIFKKHPFIKYWL